jgi:hypothetical protein
MAVTDHAVRRYYDSVFSLVVACIKFERSCSAYLSDPEPNDAVSM